MMIDLGEEEMILIGPEDLEKIEKTDPEGPEKIEKIGPEDPEKIGKIEEMREEGIVMSVKSEEAGIEGLEKLKEEKGDLLFSGLKLELLSLLTKTLTFWPKYKCCNVGSFC